MSWSLGEIEALTVKAARGAGHPWGVADEAGWAVRWLAARGLPGPEAMAGLLNVAPKDGCPLTIGIRISDSGDLTFAQGPAIIQPLIILPFLGRLAGPGHVVKVQAAGMSFQVAVGGTDLAQPLPATSQLNAHRVPGQLPAKAPLHRVENLSDESRETLERLAHRTYAPATEQSRAKGAGAGLTDND